MVIRPIPVFPVHLLRMYNRFYLLRQWYQHALQRLLVPRLRTRRGQQDDLTQLQILLLDQTDLAIPKNNNQGTQSTRPFKEKVDKLTCSMTV